MEDESRSNRLNILLLNQSWLKTELSALGHNVYSICFYPTEGDLTLDAQLRTWKDVQSLLPPNFFPDRIVVYDNARHPLVVGLEESGIPVLFFSVDTFRDSYWHIPYARCCDQLLVAQKDWLPRFSSDIPKTWFPLWTRSNKVLNAERNIPTCFRGSLDPRTNAQRTRFFEVLRKKIEVDCQPGPWGTAYARSKIVINQCVDGDVNFRIFEAVSKNALLLTPQIANGLDELFAIGTEIVTYRDNDPEHAAARIQEFLIDEDRRKKIAWAGYERFLLEHTSEHRAQRLAEILQHLTVLHSPTKQLAMAEVLLVSSQAIYSLRSELARPYALMGIQRIWSALRALSTMDEPFRRLFLNCCEFAKKIGLRQLADGLVREYISCFPNDEISLFVRYHDQLPTFGSRAYDSDPSAVLNQIEVVTEQKNSPESVSEPWRQVALTRRPKPPARSGG